MTQNAAAVNAQILTLVSGSASSVVTAYVKDVSDREVAARGVNFSKAMDALKRLQGELKKVKPDRVDITFEKVEGQPDKQIKTEVWTDASLKKKAKLVEQVTKLDGLITAFMTYDPNNLAEGEQKLPPEKEPYKLLVDFLGNLGKPEADKQED